MASSCSFLVVSFPTHGHLNPALQFALRLLRQGSRVCFLTTVFALSHITESFPGLTYLTYSDGYDDTGFPFGDGYERYTVDSTERGSRTLREMLLERSDNGDGFTCVFYTTLVPWVGRVARSLGVRSVLLWAQPATVLDVYYYYFTGRGDDIMNVGHGISSEVRLPGLPPLTRRDVPSYFNPGAKFPFALRVMESHIENLKQEKNPVVVVNTFDELEPEPLRAIEGIRMVGVGPLFPSAVAEGGANSLDGSKDYIQWLNTKEEGSVIYVSFGSLSVLSKPQMEELAKGFLGSGRPFLWVIRVESKGDKEEGGGVRWAEELPLGGKGMIVPWCSQLEVLSHPSVGCFLTHCGWNSTLEGLTCGVPLVAFPQWTDQQTNAKLVEDEWMVGVRLSQNEEGIADADNIKDCLGLILGGGEKSRAISRNVKKWKKLAREAAGEGGSSDKNLRNLIQELINSPPLGE